MRQEDSSERLEVTSQFLKGGGGGGGKVRTHQTFENVAGGTQEANSQL